MFIWLLSYLKPYKKALCLFIISELLLSISILIIPKLLQTIIDTNIILEDITNTSILFLILIIGIIVIRQTIIPIGKKYQRKLKEFPSKDIQMTSLHHLREMGIKYFENTSKGEIISILNTEVKNTQKFYNQLLPSLLQELLFLIVSIAFMIYLNFLLAILVLPILFLYKIYGPYLEKKANKAAKDLSISRINLNDKLYEYVYGIEELKLNNSYKWSIKRLLTYQSKFNDHMVTANKYAYLRGSFRRLTYYIGAIFLIITGYILIKSEYLTTGSFVAFLIYYFSSIHRMTSIVTIYTEQSLLIRQSKKLYDFFKNKKKIYVEENVEEGFFINSIQFKNVSFSYEGKRVLHNISFSIKSGEKFVIVGENGCGKSTLLKLLLRIYEPDSGEILLNDKPISCIPIELIRREIYYNAQEPFLFGKSIKDNIIVSKLNATNSEIINAAKLAQAHKYIINLPHSYHTFSGEQGSNLSSGEKQRVILSRLFLSEAKVLLLDEVTSSLDNITENDFYQSLKKKKRENIIIAVAHRYSAINKFDNVIVMKKGEIIRIGKYETLYNEKGYFYNLVRGGVGY